MKWFLDLFSSSLGRKVLMALTGLFLILFLAVHLAGNLQLLKHDDGQAFNVYAKFMTTNPVIKVISYANYAFILLHILMAVVLSKKNKAARGSQGYEIAGKSSAWNKEGKLMAELNDEQEGIIIVDMDRQTALMKTI